MERIGRIGGIEGVLPAEPAGAVAPAAGSSFGGELAKAISAVEGLQTSADAQAREVAAGGGNLHETVLALEKADVSMRLAMKIRNKLVEAYQEVMRMPV